MSEELKPCPFCGQQDAFVEQLDSDASVVICQGMVDEHCACLARGPVGVQQSELEDQPGRDAAIEAWNSRAQPAEAEGVELDTIVCWNCGQKVTLEARDDEDGFCPHCMCELDLSDYLINANAALSAVTAERDRLREEVTELDALRDKLSGLLSKTAVALRGPEPELTRYGYADIPLRVKTVIDERDQLLDGMNKIMRATGLGDDAFAIACEVVGELNGAAMDAKEE